MTLTLRPLTDPNDDFRVRNFLCEVFLLNDRLEHSWNVTCLDYWRWHFIATCQFTAPFEQVTIAWGTEKGQIAAVLHPFSPDEIRLHIHPHFHSAALENEIFAFVESHHPGVCVPVFADDTLRWETLASRGFSQLTGWNHHYRRDLDVVAAVENGEIAGFCTIYYDDYTRSAVTVLMDVAAEYWRRGLGKAVMIDGMQRLRLPHRTMPGAAQEFASHRTTQRSSRTIPWFAV